MANTLKDNASTGTPLPVLPSGEQQIIVCIYWIINKQKWNPFSFVISVSRSLVVFDQWQKMKYFKVQRL